MLEPDDDLNPLTIQDILRILIAIPTVIILIYILATGESRWLTWFLNPLAFYLMIAQIRSTFF